MPCLGNKLRIYWLPKGLLADIKELIPWVIGLPFAFVDGYLFCPPVTTPDPGFSPLTNPGSLFIN